VSDWLLLAIKGVGIGLSIIVPGMSGGTAAVILGIYQDLVEAIIRIRLQVLIPVGIGAAAGLMGGAQVVEFLFVTYPFILSSFLIGLVVASGRQLLGSVGRWRARQVVAGLVGLGAALLLSVPIWGQQADVILTLPKLVMGGLLSSAAMIIPGISGASVLIVLGQYRVVLEAVNDFRVVPLAVFGAGVLVGLAVFSRLIAYLLREFPGATAALLGGLILGSIRALWPQHVGLPEVIAFAAGLAIVEFLELLAGTKGGQMNDV